MAARASALRAGASDSEDDLATAAANGIHTFNHMRIAHAIASELTRA
jgi:hypothetical protein